ncbi:hypothetical protein PR048_020133 [Dryococelus australis]|uniref:Uncharacterized protein n=1 Tax=Dryococelus australis TaxID=614101 RepID=A0ABQ9H5F3_9NEOP|nr:hypothetical protein PR048_020133 [Dryococelus australis]
MLGIGRERSRHKQFRIQLSQMQGKAGLLRLSSMLNIRNLRKLHTFLFETRCCYFNKYSQPKPKKPAWAQI